MWPSCRLPRLRRDVRFTFEPRTVGFAILLACASAAAVSGPAAATGINLSWDECGLAGHEIQTFACNNGSTTTRTLIGSFQPPPNIQEFLGLSATLRIAANDLPDYWAMSEGQCRASAINTDFRFASGGACADFYGRNAVGGFLYETGGYGANTAKLRIQCAVPIDLRGPVDPSKQYYGFKVLITDGSVAACPGCNEPVRITLEEIQLFQPPEAANDPAITQPLDRNVAFWQAQVGGLPQIASFDPPGGAPGDQVSIRGGHLDGVSVVRFNDIVATFTIESAGLVRATVPAGARSGPIEVDSPFGTAASATPFVAAPVIESFLPARAPAGSELRLRGYNFSDVSAVKIGDVAAGFAVESDQQMRVTVPAGGDGPIAARNAGGLGASSAEFHAGVTEGQLDLAWNDCGIAGAEVMRFACDRSQGAPFVLVASMAPPSNVTHASGVVADIGVYATQLPDFWQHGAGLCRGATSLGMSFDFPTSGACENFWLRGVYGTFFYDIGYYGANTAHLRLSATMSGTAALDTRREYYAFKMNVTPSRVETCEGCDIPVRLVMQQLQIFQPSALNYNPIITQPLHRNAALWQGTPGPAPVIQAFTPAFGAAGAEMDIDGQHFTGATTLRIGGVTVPSFSVVSDARIHAVIPSDVRTGPVTVRTPFGGATSAASFVAPPVIQSFTPGQAPVGYQLEVSGYNFTGVNAVKFGNVAAATFDASSDTRLTVIVPDGAPEAPITVTNVAGSATSEGLFKVGALPIERPVITKFEPAGGAPGDLIQIDGQNFDAVTSVRFNGAESGFTRLITGALRASVPPDARTGFIQVSGPGGTATSDSLFVMRAVIQSVVPSAAPIGTPVEIRGYNFTRTDQVVFHDKLATFQLVADTLIRTQVPAGSRSGLLRVVSRGGNVTTPFTVQNDAPGTLNLSWDYCGAEGDEDETFTCDVNETSRVAFIGSFIAPSRVTEFLGASAELRFESKTDVLPDWWKFGAGTCRGPVLNVDFNFTDEEEICADPTFGRAVGGFVYEIGRDGPNTARLRIQFAVPIDDRVPLDAGREYYAFKVRIPRTKSTGTGSCEGCNAPINIEFRELQLFQPPELDYDPIITQPALRNKIRWQPAHAGPNLVTDPSFETSTGKWSPVGGATLAQVTPGLVGLSALQVKAPATAGEFGINDAPNFVPDVPAANRTYRFSVYVRTPTPGLSVQLRAREYQDRVRIQTASSEWFSPEGSWRHLQSQVTSMAAHSTIDFQIICNGGANSELWVDDVEVNLLGSEPSVHAPAKVSVNPGEPVEIEVTASDPGGEPIHALVADLRELPALSNAVFTPDPGNLRGVLRWTPQPEDGGWTYTVPFIATSVLDKTRATEIEVGPGTPIAFPPDGSFEQGLVGWTPYSTSTLTRIHGGRQGVWMAQSHQDAPTDEFGLNDHPNWIVATPLAGARYRFSAWVHGFEGSGRARIRVREFLGAAKVGVSTYSRDVVLNDRWQQVAVDHVAGAAGSSLDFQVLCVPDGDGATFFIDDVGIRPVDGTGVSALAGVESSTATFARPTVFPNPFRKRAMLGLTLGTPGRLRVALYDLGGRRVRTVFDAHAAIGTHQFELDGADDQGRRLGAGMYFYRVDSADGAQRGRFVIVE